MERWDDRPFQSVPTHETYDWNILELESRIYLRNKIHEFINLTNNSTLSLYELRRQLQQCQAQYGPQLATGLVRQLQHANDIERDAIVWLLVQLKDSVSFPLLEHLAKHPQRTRATRLSAALALAGMGQTGHRQTHTPHKSHIYALS